MKPSLPHCLSVSSTSDQQDHFHIHSISYTSPGLGTASPKAQARSGWPGQTQSRAQQEAEEGLCRSLLYNYH